MRRRIVIALALAAATLSLAALASGDVRRVGDIQVAFSGSIAPTALPRERPVPVTVSVSGRISTTDGSHPPALRRLELRLNRSGRIDNVGLPRCRAAQLQSTSSDEALSRCRGALVGRGQFGAELAEGGAPIPSHGKILAFNGQRRGKPELLLHLYGTTPIQASFVLPLKISRGDGQLGTVLTAELPKLAGGVGSVTQISLQLGREYNHRGTRRGYISASCAAPPGFTVAPFTLAVGNFHFADGTDLKATLSRTCQVKG
jgi:hypothetical protein